MLNGAEVNLLRFIYLWLSNSKPRNRFISIFLLFNLSGYRYSDKESSKYYNSIIFRVAGLYKTILNI